MRSVIVMLAVVGWSITAEAAPVLTGLGGPAGFGDEVLPIGQDSILYDTSGVFPLGVQSQGADLELWIGADGVMGINEAPPHGPLTLVDTTVLTPKLIAPYFADGDTGRRDGIPDEENRVYAASGDGWVVVTWYRLRPAGAGAGANLYQALLTQYDRNAVGDFQVELRYTQCEWSAGEQDANLADGQAGILRLGDPRVILPGSGNGDAFLGGALCLGSNVNTPGVWRLAQRGQKWYPCDGQCIADEDRDGIPQSIDNCLLVANIDQLDTDGDGEGDACEISDLDGDGVVDTADNCPMDANPDQADEDGDNIGDVCDTDIDGDDVIDRSDNCPLIPNTTQVDLDGDGEGDACDDDRDGDDVPNTEDLCPDVPDATQPDLDKDGVGDGCDPDIDGDEIEAEDNCPGVANPDQADADEDGVGDACEGDFDGDGVADEVDNCPRVPNPEQLNIDGDEQGLACDEDDDADGVPGRVDNCPATSNPDQGDADEDGVGDACDPDRDGDGVDNDEDNCPRNPNPRQIDRDDDGNGDVCDANLSFDNGFGLQGAGCSQSRGATGALWWAWLLIFCWRRRR